MESRAAANAANRPTTAAVTSRPTLHSPGLAIARSLDPLHRFPWEAPPVIRPSTAGLTVTDEEVLPYRLQGSAHFDNDEAILAAPHAPVRSSDADNFHVPLGMPPCALEKCSGWCGGSVAR